MPTLCLNMIVRDESTNIARCLDSVKKYIDDWVIVDTGSTDDTREIIKQHLDGIPGELHQHPFENFAASRNHALTLALNNTSTDYLLLIDADMTLAVGDAEFKSTLKADGYFLQTDAEEAYFNPRIISARLKWCYYGYAQDFLLSEEARNMVPHERLLIRHFTAPQDAEVKINRDKHLLESQLATEPEDSHAFFHLGIILYKQGNLDGAFVRFNQFLKSEMQWDAEWVWYAAYMQGRILEQTGKPIEQVAQAYLHCYALRPLRVEPLFQLARLYRQQGQLQLAELYGAQAMQKDTPPELFNMDRKIYDWHLPVEYAMTCFRLEQHDKAISAANRALKKRDVPHNQRDALVNSRQRSVEALYAGRRASSPPQTLNRIRVVVPFRNARHYLADCIESLQQQDYPNFTATFIDDCSDDGGAELVPVDDQRFECIVNTQRVGALVNRTEFILSCAADDIVVYLDGDDQLASDSALGFLNGVYNSYDCWLSYGQYITQLGNLGWAAPFPNPEEMESSLARGEMRFPVHALTHRAGLLHRLKEFDPALSSFKDDQGDWLFYASDAVLARPLFHMAGWEHSIYVNQVIYLYTEGHNISEFMQYNDEQMETCRIINNKFRPPVLITYQPA